MNDDEQFARRLRSYSEAMTPEIAVDTSAIIRGGRRIRTGRRLAAFGGVMALSLAAWAGLDAVPWQQGGGVQPASNDWWTSVAYDGGEITEDEYVAIVSAVRTCMVERGFDVSEVQKRMDGVSYGITISGGDGPGDTTTQENLLACEARVNLMEAELAYQAQSVLAGAERDVIFDRFQACMTSAGFPGIAPEDSARDILDRLGPVIEERGRGTVEPAEDCWNMFGVLLYGPSQ